MQIQMTRKLGTISISEKKRLNKDCKKRDKERRTLCDNQGIGQTRTYNNGKYVDTQHRGTLLHEASTNKHQGRN